MTIKGIVMLLIFAAIIAAAIVYGIVRGRLRSGPMRRYYPQPDFTPLLDSIHFLVIILIVRRVEVERADGITPGAVVPVSQHNTRQFGAQHCALRHINGIFLFLAQDFVHISPPPANYGRTDFDMYTAIFRNCDIQISF